MNNVSLRNKWIPYSLAALRIIIGWHFLYEGLIKIMDPSWTARPFLEGSRWIFGDIFRMMAASDSLMKLIDMANSIGLTLIGIALIMGLMTRLASWLGAALLLVYYLAYPPFGNYSFGTPAEGIYLIVNKNIIEIFALVLLALTQSGRFFGLDGLWKKTGSGIKAEPQSESQATPVLQSSRRRELLKGLTGIPVLALFSGAVFRNKSESVPDVVSGATIKVDYKELSDLKGSLPHGKLGDLNISRMIMGCNLIGGWAHARDLRYANTLFKAYNSEKKILETYHLAEAAGINTTFMVTQYYDAFNKYKDVYGSKMQSFCQTMLPDNDFYSDLNKAIDAGATALYVQGNEGDRYVLNGKIDQLGKALDKMKSQGYLAGIGAHSIETIKACEKEGLPADFYVKTFHQDNYWSASPESSRKEYMIIGNFSEDHNGFHDNIFDLYPSKTEEFMSQVNKPWIAFKVLAAGAIDPRNGFRHAFEGGADFICVGMFDFQVIDDVNIASEVLGSLGTRNRQWFA